MASVTNFIRNTPASSLQAYFSHAGMLASMPIDWSATEPEVVRGVIKAVDEMDEQARARVINDGERVSALADDPGQTALYSVIDDRARLDALASGQDRSLWMFLNFPVLFRHAEEVRFTDEKRRGRSWDGFVGAPNLDLRRDEAALNAFKAALRKRFAAANVHVDIFDRVRSALDGDDHELVQITVYREGLPDDQLAFDATGVLVRQPYRPVFEAAMTYEPATGVIEVVAKDRESRAEMALFLARDLLGVDFRKEKVPLRRFNLGVLLTPFEFPTDIEDRIERVEVRALRLMPLDAPGDRITLECTSQGSWNIWSMAQLRLRQGATLNGDYVCTQVRLIVWFHPKDGAKRGRRLPLMITMPHGCNLKEQTEEEQLIGEKYLRRWGILVDDPHAPTG